MKQVRFLCQLLFVFFTVLSFGGHVSLYAQNHPTGAIVPSPEEYEKLPKVKWEKLRGGTKSRASTHAIFSDEAVMLFSPEVMNQGWQGSCTGWAVGYAAASILAYPKYDRNWGIARRSSAYVFNQIKSSNDCKGASIIAALELIKTEGVCSYAEMLYDRDDCSVLPNNTQRLDALSNTILGWGILAHNDLLGIKRSLDLGYPVVISYAVTETFDRIWRENGIWNTSNASDTSRGIMQYA